VPLSLLLVTDPKALANFCAFQIATE
jgi:hypothetical protein